MSYSLKPSGECAHTFEPWYWVRTCSQRGIVFQQITQLFEARRGVHRYVALLETHHSAKEVEVADGRGDVGQIDGAVAILAV